MDFSDQLVALAAKARKVGKSLQTEEATKTALIMPFIQIMGYDVFNPEEVIPEFTADIGDKKGEKVDYAICHDGKLIMLVECKTYGAPLEEGQCTQLRRYFNVTEAPVGILTDGNRYRFFSDLEEKNRMDSKPYMEFSLEDMDERLIVELKKLAKGKFDILTALSAASELKYTKEIKRILGEQMESPEDDFIRFFVSKVHEGKFTQTVKDRFSPIVKSSIHQFMNDRINDRLKSAMTESGVQSTHIDETKEVEDISVNADTRVVTTEEEWQAFYLVKSLLIGVIEPERIAIRDGVTYCAILLDDNNRKPIIRLHFNSAQKRVGLFDHGKKDEKVDISTLEDILLLAERIRATAKEYSEALAR